MKLRFLLIASVLLFPLLLNAQIGNPPATGDMPTTAVKFYSEGKMYVGDTGDVTNPVSMHVDGSMKFSSAGGVGGTVKGQTQVKQIGITELTGDFVDAIETKHLTDPDLLFDTSTGVLSFVGIEKIQYIYRDQSTLKLREANGFNYINFPIVRVNQQLTSTNAALPGNYKNADMTKKLQVSIQPHVAMSVADIQLGNYNGNNYIGAFTVTTSYNPTSPANRALYIPRVYIDKINGAATEIASASSNGWFRYNLILNSGKYAIAGPNANVTDQSIFPGGGAANIEKRHLTPFASPFKQLALDHFLYGFVLRVDRLNSAEWINGQVITDPASFLTAGRGYFLAMEAGVDFKQTGDAMGFDFAEITAKYSTKSAGRTYVGFDGGGYEFSRQLLKEHQSFLTSRPRSEYAQFSSAAVASNTLKEYFTRTTEEVEIELGPGLNFIANPYMVPLNLTPVLTNIATENFLKPSEAGKTLEFVGSLITPLPTKDYQLRNRFFTIYNSEIEYLRAASAIPTWWGNVFRFKLGSYVAQGAGGTASLLLGNPAGTYVNPLTVFALQSNSTFKAKIQPPAITNLIAKTGANAPIDPVTPKIAKSSTDPIDEVLFQTINKTTGMEDRISLVFRDMAMNENTYDHIKAYKNFSPAFEAQEPLSFGEGTLFTKNISGEALAINALSTNVKQLALYVVPPTEGEELIEITPYRMNTLQSIQRIWIEDKLTGDIKELQPEETIEYTIVPTGEDPKVSLKNRFVLYFNELPEDLGTGIIPEDSPISVAYFTQTIYIQGLNDDDNGSKVEIYDLQGRLVTRNVINTIPTMDIYKPLSQGAYIVKITGKRNYTGKFMSLKN